MFCIQSILHLGHLEAVRPMPAVRVSGNFIMCWNVTSYKRRYMCRKKGCTYAHTYLEQKAWNRAKKIQAGYFPINCMYNMIDNKIIFNAYQKFFGVCSIRIFSHLNLSTVYSDFMIYFMHIQVVEKALLGQQVMSLTMKRLIQSLNLYPEM